MLTQCIAIFNARKKLIHDQGSKLSKVQLNCYIDVLH